MFEIDLNGYQWPSAQIRRRAVTIPIRKFEGRQLEMTVTIETIDESNLPEKYRDTHLTVWAVKVNGGLYRYCVSEGEAIALKKRLEQVEEDNKPKFTRSRP